MPSVLDDYLAQITDADLRTKIRGEFEKTTKDFGLVFERHQQEGIRMPKAPVELGSKVIVEADDTFHHVVAVDGDQVTVVNRDGDLTTLPTAGVTVAREFGDIMYPGLTPVDELRLGKPGDPVHTVINGENYHALEMLQYTHAGKVDLIYVDPPYNTGNKTWKYNDRYVAEKDSYRHSKWLSFMEKRLLLAKKLLTPTGVIIVAIGDDEHHRLRMLMDQVFGAGNFISNVVWNGGRKNDSVHVSNGADYMLIYGRDVAGLRETGSKWREEKIGVEEVLAAGQAAWAESRHDEDVAHDLMKSWFKAQPKDSPVQAMARNTYYLPDGGLARDDNITWPGGGGARYDVLHPATGQPVPIPERGWLYSTPERMQRAVEAGEVIFRADHTKPISLKKRLEDVTGQAVQSVFEHQRTHSGRHLKDVLGDKRFPFPKDHTVLQRWIGLIAPKNAVILDFFGGSGTTAEAVMRLNAEDGGTRQAILVTNNELSAADDKKLRAAGFGPGDDEYEALGVFHHVTKQRIHTVASGIREDGSKYSDGLAANVAFFNLEYLDRARVKYGHEFDSLASVFWLRAGAVGPLIHRESLAQGFAVDPDAALAVLFRPGRASALADALRATPHPNLTRVFIVTDSDEQGNVAASYFDPNLTVERIYGSYLSAFAVNKKD